jgi:hypothetical protein
MEKEKRINIKEFIAFLFDIFSSQITYYEDFLPNLHFVEINCFPSDFDYKLSIEISDRDIKFGLVTKEPSIDFSLYDYVIENNLEAEQFVKEIRKLGWPNRN